MSLIANAMLNKTDTLQIELERPEAEWKTHNAWFVRQMDFNTKFRPRVNAP